MDAKLSRRGFVGSLAALGLAGIAGRAIAADAAAKPNIIFIMADDAGIGDFGCYGGKHIATPNIDKLAAEGMQFSQAYSASAVCAPTRCGLMTGLHLGHAPIRANREIQPEGQMPLPEGLATVAEVVKGAGYATACIGKWGLGMFDTVGSPLKRGFDHFFGYGCQRHAHSYFPAYLYNNDKRFELEGNDGKTARKTYAQDLIADDTLAWVEKNAAKPFFLFYAITLPHGKYEIPSNVPYDQKPWPKNVQNYAAMVSRLDSDIGRLMKKLKDLGIDEKTLVIFTSDNGTNTEFIKPLNSSAGLRGNKRLLYEGGIKAPFIARWPGKIQPGTSSALLTGHVDVLATVADAAGAAIPANTDGISILPTLLGREQAKTHEFLYFEIYESFFQQAVRLGDWKGYRTGTKAPLELYNLKADPAEQTNVAAEHPDMVKQIEAILTREHIPTLAWPAPEFPKKPPAKKP